METKRDDATTHELISILQEYGSVRVIKIKKDPTHFWAVFSEITHDKPIDWVIMQAMKKHGKVFAFIKGHREVSTYYRDNL